MSKVTDPLYFRENQTKGKDAIVLLHGGGMTGRGWQSTLAALTEYHCLAPDLPGCGRSAHITPFDQETTVEGVAHLIRTHVPSGRAALVGLSIGANVSIGLSEHYPELVDKAFLTGTAPRLSRLATFSFLTILRILLPLMRSQRRSRKKRAAPRPRTLTANRVAQVDERVNWLTIKLINQMLEMANSQAEPFGNNTPTTVLVGERELRVNKNKARAVLNSLANGEGYAARGLGHSWPLEEPATFRRALRAWMTDAELGDEFISLTS